MDHRPHTDRTTPPSERELDFARRHVRELVRAGAINRQDAAIRIGSLEVWAKFGRVPADWEFTDLCLWGAFRPLPREAVVYVTGDDDEDDAPVGDPPPQNVDYRALTPCSARRRARARRLTAHRSRGRDRGHDWPRNRTARATR